MGQALSDDASHADDEHSGVRGFGCNGGGRIELRRDLSHRRASGSRAHGIRCQCARSRLRVWVRGSAQIFETLAYTLSPPPRRAECRPFRSWTCWCMHSSRDLAFTERRDECACTHRDPPCDSVRGRGLEDAAWRETASPPTNRYVVRTARCARLVEGDRRFCQRA